MNFESLRVALNEVRLDLDQEWFDARTGVSAREMVRMIARLAGAEVDVDAVAAARDRNCLLRIAEVGEVRHVVDVLRCEHNRRKTLWPPAAARPRSCPRWTRWACARSST